MPKIIPKYTSLIAGALLVATVVSPTATFAQSARSQEARQEVEDRRQDGRRTNELVQNRENGRDNNQRSEEAQTRIMERREQGTARLEEARLRVCQNREQAIQNIMARIADRGVKQLAVFTKIADRVQSFYIEQDATLDNYDTLVEDLRVKKEAAESSVALVASGSDDFSCDGDNPIAIAGSFKEDMHAMNDALKAYKTAVRELIVGVKSAQDPTTFGSDEGGEE